MFFCCAVPLEYVEYEVFCLTIPSCYTFPLSPPSFFCLFLSFLILLSFLCSAPSSFPLLSSPLLWSCHPLLSSSTSLFHPLTCLSYTYPLILLFPSLPFLPLLILFSSPLSSYFLPNPLVIPLHLSHPHFFCSFSSCFLHVCNYM